MKHNKGFIMDAKTETVLPGWMSAVLFNFDEPEETAAYIHSVAALSAGNATGAMLIGPQEVPAKMKLRKN